MLERSGNYFILDDLDIVVLFDLLPSHDSESYDLVEVELLIKIEVDFRELGRQSSKPPPKKVTYSR